MPITFDTIYPRLNPNIAATDLRRVYTPTAAEWTLAEHLTSSPAACLGFLLHLKTFQRLGYFVALHTIPERIVHHIAESVDLRAYISALPAYDHSGTRRRHQTNIRAYRGVTAYQQGGRAIIQAAMAAAAIHTEQLEDLINAAIEELIRRSYELPGFTSLLKEARRQRTQTYAQFYHQVKDGLTPAMEAQLDGLLVVDSATQRSPWDRLKDPTGKASLTNLKRLADHLTWLTTYQPIFQHITAIPEAKRRHFVDEAFAYDVSRMATFPAGRRYTLMCAFLAGQYAQTLDDIAQMLIKRVRSIQAVAKAALDRYHRDHQDRTDRLVDTLRRVVVGYQQPGETTDRLGAIDAVLAGQTERVLQDCDAHLTYAGNNFAPFMWAAFKSHRATLFRLLKLLPLRSANQHTDLVDAIAFLCSHERTKSPYVSVMQKDWINPMIYKEIPLLDLQWVPVGWWRLVTDQTTRSLTPHTVNRRHFEVCVFSQLLTALTIGDIYIVGAERYGDPFPQLCSWDEYHARIADYGAQLGIAVDPDAFVAQQQQWLADIATATDAAFPANHQVRLVDGRPVIRRARRTAAPAGLAVLKRRLEQRQVQRSILDALVDTDHWLNWTRFFGPLSGLDGKLANAKERYLATVFGYGCQLGPSATAAALGTVDRRQIARVHQQHISEDNLDSVIQCLVNAYQRCALPQLWGSLDHASIDGTKWEVYEQNLLSEHHLRYGGYGGIAVYLLSSTYIALMTNFIACSAWEGHYLLDVLEQNRSSIQPTTIHSDTQGQNEAIFGLAFLRGIDLMPRIRDWQDLKMYRPSADAQYAHIDAVFTDRPIDWALIRDHLPDLLRIALSIKEGRIVPSTILRTISAGSSRLAQAYRELGRARRTGFLLRFMAEADLRALIQRETNKSEQFNNFIKWVGFGSAGVIRENRRREQRKIVKYTMVVANALMFHTTVILADDLRALIQQGYHVAAACVMLLSPYGTKGYERFGRYTLNFANPPLPIDYDTPVVSDDPMPMPDAAIVNGASGATAVSAA